MTQPFKYLVKDIEKKRKELVKIVENHYGKGTAPTVTVSFDLDSVRTLGQCQSKSNKVSHLRLNPNLLNELKEVYINEVYVHEFAHACVRTYIGHYRNGRRVMPHGPDFKNFCRAFGISGRATTNIASNSKTLKEKKKTKSLYPYECGCMLHEVSTIKHNRMRRGSTYTCRRCGNDLVFKSRFKKKIAA